MRLFCLNAKPIIPGKRVASNKAGQQVVAANKAYSAHQEELVVDVGQFHVSFTSVLFYTYSQRNCEYEKRLLIDVSSLLCVFK